MLSPIPPQPDLRPICGRGCNQNCCQHRRRNRPKGHRRFEKQIAQHWASCPDFHQGSGDRPPRPLKSTSWRPQATNADIGTAQMSAVPANPARKELAKWPATYCRSTNHVANTRGPAHNMNRRTASMIAPLPLIVVRSNSSSVYRPRRKLATIAAMSKPTNIIQRITHIPATSCPAVISVPLFSATASTPEA